MGLEQIRKSADTANSGKKSGLPAGEVFNPGNMVEYGENAIVSRTLINNDAGTVTLFAFDEGQGLSEHTAPFDALVHIVEGEGEVIIAGNASRVGAGEFILMPANVPHALNANVRFKMILTMLRK
jgi:quercetin dioxygenase-like cupin family protein